MQKRPVQAGRPAGATTFDAELAQAFGAAVRALRSGQGMAQEALAHRAGIERSHMGKIERGLRLQARPAAAIPPGRRDRTGRQAVGLLRDQIRLCVPSSSSIRRA